jgi:hypothetical protein
MGNGCIVMDELLKKAQQALCIRTVNLKESRVLVGDDVDPYSLSSEETKTQSFRTVTKVRELVFTDPDDNEIRDYRFLYSVGVRLIRAADEDEANRDPSFEPLVEVFAIFEARYLSKTVVSKEELNVFSKDNVGYHVWPYWRELAQSSCSRIGMSPVFEVPVYIVNREVSE